MRKVNEADGNVDGRVNELKRQRERREIEAGSENGMALSKGLNAVIKGLEIEMTFEVKAEDIVISGGVGGELAMKEHASLKGSKRISVNEEVWQKKAIVVGDEIESVGARILIA